MAVPVSPAAYNALIINPSDSFCVAFKKYLKSLYFDYLIMRYETDDDGEITDGFAHDICSKLDCPEIITEE